MWKELWDEFWKAVYVLSKITIWIWAGLVIVSVIGLMAWSMILFAKWVMG